MPMCTQKQCSTYKSTVDNQYLFQLLGDRQTRYLFPYLFDTNGTNKHSWPVNVDELKSKPQQVMHPFQLDSTSSMGTSIMRQGTITPLVLSLSNDCVLSLTSKHLLDFAMMMWTNNKRYFQHETGLIICMFLSKKRHTQ